jgi:hypothetical protein
MKKTLRPWPLFIFQLISIAASVLGRVGLSKYDRSMTNWLGQIEELSASNNLL